MTEIERKALALVNEVQVDLGMPYGKSYSRHWGELHEALCRAIEQHEAFRQEVSDAVEQYQAWAGRPHIRYIERFIIAKPDPLVDAWRMAFPGNHIEDARDECAKISAAIENCGGKIVWGEGA